MLAPVIGWHPFLASVAICGAWLAVAVAAAVRHDRKERR